MITVKKLRRNKDNHKIISLHSSDDLIGCNYALRFENDVKIILYVSPAVYELLSDPDVSEIIMKQLQVLDMNGKVTDIIEALLK
jgi:hypothetical protein